MTIVGFLGPGVMGRPMAANLVRAGHDVRIFARSDTARERAASTGGTVVPSIHEACADADVVMTMLPDGSAVLDVLEDVVGAMPTDSVLVDHSTISPAESVMVHDISSKAGIRCIDAPVSGGEVGAVEGTLSIMVGGDKAIFDEVRPLLEAIGTTAVHVGGRGAGQVVKAANQMMVAGHLQMLAEALVFLRAHDADLPKSLEVLGGGLAGSKILERKREAMLSTNFTPGFRIALHNKDLGIVCDSARERGLALPAASLMMSLVAAVKARGGADLDHSALYQLALDLNGMGAD